MFTFLIQYSPNIAFFIEAFTFILSKYNFKDAFFYFNEQRIFIKPLGLDYLTNSKKWIGLQKKWITLFFVYDYEANETLFYDYNSAYNRNIDIYFMPYSWYTKRLIYYNGAKPMQSKTGYERIFSCGKRIVSLINEREDIEIYSGGSALEMIDSNTRETINKIAPNGIPLPYEVDILFPIRIDNFAIVSLKKNSLSFGAIGGTFNIIAGEFTNLKKIDQISLVVPTTNNQYKVLVSENIDFIQALETPIIGNDISLSSGENFELKNIFENKDFDIQCSYPPINEIVDANGNIENPLLYGIELIDFPYFSGVFMFVKCDKNYTLEIPRGNTFGYRSPLGNVLWVTTAYSNFTLKMFSRDVPNVSSNYDNFFNNTILKYFWTTSRVSDADFAINNQTMILKIENVFYGPWINTKNSADIWGYISSVNLLDFVLQIEGETENGDIISSDWDKLVYLEQKIYKYTQVRVKVKINSGDEVDSLKDFIGSYLYFGNKAKPVKNEQELKYVTHLKTNYEITVDKDMSVNVVSNAYEKYSKSFEFYIIMSKLNGDVFRVVKLDSNVQSLSDSSINYTYQLTGFIRVISEIGYELISALIGDNLVESRIVITTSGFNQIQINLNDFPCRFSQVGYFTNLDYPIYEDAYIESERKGYVVGKYINGGYIKDKVRIEINSQEKIDETKGLLETEFNQYPTLLVSGSAFKEGIRMFKECFRLNNYMELESVIQIAIMLTPKWNKRENTYESNEYRFPNKLPVFKYLAMTCAKNETDISTGVDMCWKIDSTLAIERRGYIEPFMIRNKKRMKLNYQEYRRLPFYKITITQSSLSKANPPKYIFLYFSNYKISQNIY